MRRSLPMFSFGPRTWMLLGFAGIAAFPGAAVAQCGGDGVWTTPFEVPTGPDNTVNSLTSWDPDGPGPALPLLVVGGTFLNAGGAAVSRVATWNGSSWAAMGSGTATGLPQVLMAWDPDGTGSALAQVAFGGFFTTVGGVSARNVAHWDGSAWSPFGGGTQDISGLPDVYAMTLWDPDGPAEMGGGPLPAQLVIGGDFTVAGGASRRRIARWDGTNWQAFGSGMTDSVYCLCTFDADGDGPGIPRLIAGGFFGSAGGVACSRIAMWNGTAWEPLGAGLNGQVECVASIDFDGPGPGLPQLFAGGTFLTSGATTVARIARWDGSAWQPIGAGLSDRPFSMVSWDPDGGGPLGPQLVVGGAFNTAGGVTVNKIARYDGSQWHAFGTGMNNTVFEVATWDADGDGPQSAQLIAGGLFTSAGGLPASHIAAWAATASCPADFNCSGGVDPDDLSDFITCYFSAVNTPGSCPAADFNSSGITDPDDVSDYITSFFGSGAC